jgi:hypothetical protein
VTLPAKTVHVERISESEVEAYGGCCATPFDFTPVILRRSGIKEESCARAGRAKRGRALPGVEK